MQEGLVDKRSSSGEKQGTRKSLERRFKERKVNELITELRTMMEVEAEGDRKKNRAKFDFDDDLDAMDTNTTIYFGSVPLKVNCSMMFTLLMIFGRKLGQLMVMKDDV